MNFLMKIKLLILLLLLTLSSSARPVDDLDKSTQTCKGWVRWDLNWGYNPNDYKVYVGTNDHYLYSYDRKDIQLKIKRTYHSITVNYTSNAQSKTRHPMYLCQKSFADGTSSGDAHNQSEHVPCDDWCTTVYTGGGCPPNPQPQVSAKFSISDKKLKEGNSGTTYFSFKITLNQALNKASYVYYKTSNGSAHSGEDYNSANTYAYFYAGQTSKTIYIRVKGDTKVENDETFYVDLYNPHNAKIDDGHGVGTIINDDSPTISISDKKLTEGDSGTKNFQFTIYLNSTSNKYISVKYRTKNSTAKANEDYNAIHSKTLYFSPGQKSKTIIVKVKGDTKVENDETFYVDLYSSKNANISKSRGVGTIVNDDSTMISISDKKLTEGNSGTKDFTFTISLNKKSTKKVTVKYKTTNGTAKSNEDYTALSLKTLTFNAGETSKTVIVKVKGDTKVEDDETFYIDLSSATNAKISKSRGIGTILNDDIPDITISDVALKEGDIGTKNFIFTVSLNKKSTKKVTVKYKTTNGTAKSNEDYTALSLKTLTFNAGETSKTIIVKVKGDTKVENDETFYLELSSAVYANLSDNQGLGTILNDDHLKEKGRFNIERTDSGKYTIMSDERNAWYTQIVGRDFDYSLVFYKDDFSAEKNISNVTVNIELLNEDTNASLYTRKFHISKSHKGSRVDITKPLKDLDKLPATKDAIFRVTYGVDGAGNIIQANCISNPTLCTNKRKDYAQDNFAIRPESFYISIADKDIIRKENNSSKPDPLRVASGYDYNLTVMATQYPKNKYHLAKGYNAKLNANLRFTTKGTCADESNSSIAMIFKNGQFNNLNFTHNNVGDYRLSVFDNTWTKVDSDKKQCIKNQTITTPYFNTPQGCNIKAISDINLSFYPYQFKVDFIMNNLPNSGHNDFIYMSELSNAYNQVSLQLDGNITAQNEKNATTTNFTKSCVATDTQLLTSTDMLTDEGNGTKIIRTIINPTTNNKVDINITRMSLFNHKNINSSATYDSLVNMDTPLNIPSNKFLDENNGTLFLELRYNIEKHLFLPINPVQFQLKKLIAKAEDANSTAKNMVEPTPYIPIGEQTLGKVKNFYFSRVSSDKENYPRISLNNTNTIRTPLNIDIFCDGNISFCTQTGVRVHTVLTSDSSANIGWYLSKDHNETLDGGVTLLTSTYTTLSINPFKDITFEDGREGLIFNQFNDCTNKEIKVVISPNTPLLYATNPNDNGKPFYTVSCTDNNSSELSGIGQTGNIINNEANTNQTSKIDW